MQTPRLSPRVVSEEIVTEAVQTAWGVRTASRPGACPGQTALSVAGGYYGGGEGNLFNRQKEMKISFAVALILICTPSFGGEVDAKRGVDDQLQLKKEELALSLMNNSGGIQKRTVRDLVTEE